MELDARVMTTAVLEYLPVETGVAPVAVPASNRWARLGVLSFHAASFALCSVLLLWLAVSLYMRHNRFPVYYHPDELSKGHQIQADERNFNHPQLMLECAIWMMQKRGIEPMSLPPDLIVYQGRDCSALLAAGAVVLLGWAGFVAAGWRGFALVGLAAALCPPLLAHSRYFKEEPSLMLGVAAVVLTGALFCRLRHWGWQIPLALVLGAAVALAASGKYAGVVMLVPAALVIILTNARRWYLIPVLLATMTWSGWQTWQSINWRAVQDWDAFVGVFEREHDHATTSHNGVTLEKPTPFFIEQMWFDAMPHTKALAIAAPFAWLLTRRRRGVGFAGPSMTFAVWLGLTLGVYTLAVSWSSIPFYRYILPSSVLLYAFAALAGVWLIGLIENRVARNAAFATLLIGLAGWQADRVRDFDRQFVHDSRDEAAKWVRTHIPTDAVVVADGYTELNRGPANWTGVQIIRTQYAADAGSIDSLIARSVRYVAVADSSYDRFLSPHTRAAENEQREFEYRQRFYRELFQTQPVAWMQRAKHPMHTFTNPDIVIFRLIPRAP